MSEAKLPPKLLLNCREAAASLGVCQKTLYSHTQPRGKLPCVRKGSAVRYSITALQNWIAEQEQKWVDLDTAEGPSSNPSLVPGTQDCCGRPNRS